MKGTHGTCVSYAEQIRKNGFNSSSLGRAGDGIYFWAYNDGNESFKYATDLAKSWWKQRLYKNCKKKSCSVIYVKLIENTGLYIDLESHEFKISKAVWVNRAYKSLLKENSNHRLSVTAANNLYIKWLEEDLGHKIDIYSVNMNPPTPFSSVVPFEIGGWPNCFVVRDKKCITIIDIKICEDEK